MGIKCAHCCYGRYVYAEQYNTDKTTYEVCSKYRPVEIICCPVSPKVFEEVKDE